VEKRARARGHIPKEGVLLDVLQSPVSYPLVAFFPVVSLLVDAAEATAIYFIQHAQSTLQKQWPKAGRDPGNPSSAREVAPYHCLQVILVLYV
jgi:hypothetical protein